MICKLNIFYFSAPSQKNAKKRKKKNGRSISIYQFDVFTDWCFLLKYSLWLLTNDLLRFFYVTRNDGKKRNREKGRSILSSSFHVRNLIYLPIAIFRERGSFVSFTVSLISQMTIGTANSTFLFPLNRRLSAWSERAPVKYCGRRSAILTRDARVLSGKFTRTDRRSMNPGSVADKSARQVRVPLEPRLYCQRTVPHHDYRDYESRKRLNYDLYIPAIRVSVVETRLKIVRWNYRRNYFRPFASAIFRTLRVPINGGEWYWFLFSSRIKVNLIARHIYSDMHFLYFPISFTSDKLRRHIL